MPGLSYKVDIVDRLDNSDGSTTAKLRVKYESAGHWRVDVTARGKNDSSTPPNHVLYSTPTTLYCGGDKKEVKRTAVDVTYANNPLYVPVGVEVPLGETLNPADVKGVKFESTKPAVATVAGTKVKGVEAGHAEVKLVRDDDGKAEPKKNLKVVVLEVTYKPDQIYIPITKSYELEVEVKPDPKDNNDKVIVESEAPATAEIEGVGTPPRVKVKGVAVGETKLKAKIKATGVEFKNKATVKVGKDDIAIKDVNGTSNKIPYVIASVPQQMESPKTWTAELVPPNDKKDKVQLSYIRDGKKPKEIAWGGDPIVFDDKGKLNFKFQFLDGTEKSPTLATGAKKDILQLTGVQQGDWVIVTDTASGATATVAVVMNYTWNVHQRTGGNLTFAPPFDVIPKSIQDNIIDTIRFSLNPGIDSAQAKNWAKVAATLKTGSVASVTISAAGTGYTSPPKVKFGGSGSDAKGTAILNDKGGVASVKVTDPGENYDPATTTVAFDGGGGAGATATAVVTLYSSFKPPSAYGIGVLPWDFDHGHLALEIPLGAGSPVITEANDFANLARTEQKAFSIVTSLGYDKTTKTFIEPTGFMTEADRENYRKYNDDLKTSFAKLITNTWNLSDSKPFMVYHTMEFERYGTGITSANPIRQIRTDLGKAPHFYSSLSAKIDQRRNCPGQGE